MFRPIPAAAIEAAAEAIHTELTGHTLRYSGMKPDTVRLCTKLARQALQAALPLLQPPRPTMRDRVAGRYAYASPVMAPLYRAILRASDRRRRTSSIAAPAPAHRRLARGCAMIGGHYLSPAPGLYARDLPPTTVTVQDPAGRHRFFSTARQATRFGDNMMHGVPWTVCVRVDGEAYVVPAAFVRDVAQPAADAPSAIIIPFPPGGWRGGAA